MLLLESHFTALIAELVSIALAYRMPEMTMNAANAILDALLPLMRPNWHVFGYLTALGFAVTIAFFGGPHARHVETGPGDRAQGARRHSHDAVADNRWPDRGPDHDELVLLTAADLFAGMRCMVKAEEQTLAEDAYERVRAL